MINITFLIMLVNELEVLRFYQNYLVFRLFIDALKWFVLGRINMALELSGVMLLL